MSPEEFENKYDRFFEKAKIDLGANKLIDNAINEIEPTVSKEINGESDMDKVIANATIAAMQFAIKMDTLNRDINKEILKKFMTENHG